MGTVQTARTLMAMEQAPPGVDPHIPNAARMYDYFLDGKDNFRADRELAELVLSVLPETRDGARENRKLIGRVVEYLIGQGIRQFVDLGSGLPAQQNVHEVAFRLAPDARVVYVDNDAVVCTHGRALLAGGDNVAMVQGDVRKPGSILDNPEVRGLIDFEQPVAVLMMFLLHLISDEDDPQGFVAAYRDAMAPGSHLVISHVGSDAAPERTARISEFYQQANAPFCPRTGEEIARFFGDFELIPPGLANGRKEENVWPFTDPASEMFVDEEMARMGYVGVARKP
ncbi:SAM-dependent methyltransferase [Streptosporangium sp. NBC_01756]|uniref:SAM-dependent methyltransferase n=1 Tax=Streptosporangium sp. NBC_01756 TaxID=2975950 RepID=UPI002DD86368|nr:SAM-dependent methyltransferase [Streptosporangium sp. NBC_01756]WSC83170.1 SAM-dependent methyltransferase [Streptosporangium sp. NBC_01756]